MLNFFSDDWFSDTGFTIFSILPFMFVIVFAIIIFAIITSAITSLRTKAINDAAPRLKSQVRIISKRTSVHGIHGGHTTTDYFITFEFEDNSRQEFQVNDYEYGTLIEGDSGILEHQGSRYLGFERRY